jgi:hypothetical protein
MVTGDGRKDTRRFSLSLQAPRFPQLADFARRSYAHVMGPRTPVSLQYLDEEDDLVNISSELEMNEAINSVLNRGQNILKIAVDVLQDNSFSDTRAVGGTMGSLSVEVSNGRSRPRLTLKRGFSETEPRGLLPPPAPLLDPSGRAPLLDPSTGRSIETLPNSIPEGGTLMLRLFWDVGFTRRAKFDARLTLRGLLRQEGIFPESQVVVNGRDWQLSMDQPIGSLLQDGDALSCWTSIGRSLARPPDPPDLEDLNHWTTPNVVLCDVKFNYVPRHVCLTGILAGRILPFTPERWLAAQPMMHRGRMDGFSQPLEHYYRMVLSHESTMTSFVLSYAAHLQSLLKTGTRAFPPSIQHPNFRVDLLMRWLNEIRTAGHPFASGDDLGQSSSEGQSRASTRRPESGSAGWS